MDKLNAVGLALLNGIHCLAEFTFQNWSGGSVIDMIWTNAEVANAIQELKVWSNIYTGDHSLVSVDLPWPHNTADTSRTVRRRESFQRGSRESWNCSSTTDWNVFHASCNKYLSAWLDSFAQIASLEVLDPELCEPAWSEWLLSVSLSAEEGLGKVVSREWKGQSERQDPHLQWLIQQRNESRNIRNRLIGDDRMSAHTVYSEYRKLVKTWIRHQSLFRVSRANEDLRQSHSLKLYWKKLKRFVGLAKPSTGIPLEVVMDGVVVRGNEVSSVWRKAFEDLGSGTFQEGQFNSEFASRITSEVQAWQDSFRESEGKVCLELDGPITRLEVQVALSQLNQGKASGIDGIVNEILKFGGDTMQDSIWNLLNIMFACEKVPLDWSRGIIFPIHKEGDERNPSNYRGITLLSVVGKLYSAILTRRLSKWCEKHSKISDEQCGFRSKRATTDQLFILSELLQQRKEKGEDTTCCFLDIKKAYDMVFRDGIWKRLLDVGVNGKLWRVIRSLYATVESCVLIGSIFTEYFKVELGLRQGDPQSPILYAIFIDGLIQLVKDAPEGIYLGSIKINILGFADDLVLIARNKEDMQRLLDRVYLYSMDWRFLWNVDKSKIMVFTLKRVNLDLRPLFIGVTQLEEVKSFKYLGIDFKTNMSWILMRNRAVKKARVRTALVSKAIAEGLMPEASLKMWFTLIRPILEYGIEIWGVTKIPQIERAQLEVGRRILGVSIKTASEAIRGELGLWSMSARRDLALLRWWGKLVKMDSARLCAQVYRHRKTHIRENYSGWCRRVKTLLEELKVGHLWLSEEVGNGNTWRSKITSWIAAREKTVWQQGLLEKEKLRFYRTLKMDLSLADYLNHVHIPHHRKEISILRCGTNDLAIETGRWEKLLPEDRKCVICFNGSCEDEQHVLLDCPAYGKDRRRLFDRISEFTGNFYNLSVKGDDRPWLVSFLLGQAVRDVDHRKIIQKEIGAYLFRVMRQRKKWLVPR